jgi:hypothetical protein
MHAQISQWLGELEACTMHARRLADRAGDAGFRTRPPSGRWSLGEHLAHLNLTSEAYLPILEGLQAANATAPRDMTRRYSRDWLGAFLVWTVEPPVRLMRVKTPPAFVPNANAPRAQVLAAFEHLNGALAACVSKLAGLDLNAARVASPFATNVKYNGWTAITVITAHERRHLWLAEHG